MSIRPLLASMVHFKRSVLLCAPICSFFLPAFVLGMPKETGSPYRSLFEIEKRQDDSPYDGPAPEVDNGDPEPYSDTDYLRGGRLWSQSQWTLWCR